MHMLPIIFLCWLAGSCIDCSWVGSFWSRSTLCMLLILFCIIGVFCYKMGWDSTEFVNILYTENAVFGSYPTYYSSKCLRTWILQRFGFSSMIFWHLFVCIIYYCETHHKIVSPRTWNKLMWIFFSCFYCVTWIS